MADYKYQIVKGAGVYGPLTSLYNRKQAFSKLTENFEDKFFFEIERVELLPTQSRRYFRWRNGGWKSARNYVECDETTKKRWYGKT